MSKHEIKIQTEAAKTEWFEPKGYDIGFRNKSIFLEKKDDLHKKEKIINNTKNTKNSKKVNLKKVGKK